tara:strand:+ start:70 stop:288 length:219 start_codon:yes stop_codon:yes gene_type:complete
MIDKFITDLKNEVFIDTDISIMTPNFEFKHADEWDSLLALEMMAHFDTELGIKITSDQIKSATTLKDLYDLI